MYVCMYVCMHHRTYPLLILTNHHSCAGFTTHMKQSALNEGGNAQNTLFGMSQEQYSAIAMRRSSKLSLVHAASSTTTPAEVLFGD